MNGMIRLQFWCWFFFLFLFKFSNAFSYDGPQLSTSRFLEKFKKDLYHIWFEGQRDLYVPLYAWHNRLMYSSKKIATYNEFPAGLGIGKSFWDEYGNWQALYGIVFLDSHKHVEPFGGYQKLYMYHLNEKISAGLGVTLAITARPEIFHNIPFPLILPLAALNYKNFMLSSAYLPGRSKNDGNVLFLYLNMSLS